MDKMRPWLSRERQQESRTPAGAVGRQPAEGPPGGGGRALWTGGKALHRGLNDT